MSDEMMPVEIRCPAWDGPDNRAGRRAHRRCPVCGGTGRAVKYLPIDSEEGQNDG